MKAKEMFKNVDYELVENTRDRMVYRNRYYQSAIIEFDKRFEWVLNYEVHEIFHDEEVKLPLAISYPELEAINQQVKELGWND